MHNAFLETLNNQGSEEKTFCKIWQGVKVGPGPWDPELRDPGPPSEFETSGAGTLLKFKNGTPGPQSKFESRTPGPTSKCKNGTHIIVFETI